MHLILIFGTPRKDIPTRLFIHLHISTYTYIHTYIHICIHIHIPDTDL